MKATVEETKRLKSDKEVRIDAEEETKVKAAAEEAKGLKAENEVQVKAGEVTKFLLKR